MEVKIIRNKAICTVGVLLLFVFVWGGACKGEGPLKENAGDPARSTPEALLQENVTTLLRMLKKGTRGLDKAQIIMALGSKGPRAKSAVREIAKYASSDDMSTRSAAIWALGAIGKESYEYVPRIVETLTKEEDPYVQQVALKALGDIRFGVEKYLAEIEPFLKSQDPGVRAACAYCLGRLEYAARPALGQLKSLMKDPEWPVRERAIWALGRMGRLAKDALPALFHAATEESNILVKRAAIQAIAKIGVRDLRFLKPLEIMLRDKDPVVRALCVGTLGNMEERAKGAVSALFKTLEDPSPEVRYLAIKALLKIGADKVEMMKRLVPLLEDENYEVRSAAARAFGTIGEAAHGYVPRLLKMAMDRSEKAMVRRAASWAIMKVGEKAIPHLKETLESHDEALRKGALDALAAYGDRARPSLPAIRRLLKDPSPVIRKEAEYAIKAIEGSKEKRKGGDK